MANDPFSAKLLPAPIMVKFQSDYFYQNAFESFVFKIMAILPRSRTCNVLIQIFNMWFLSYIDPYGAPGVISV